jgi:hypothetical protein
LHDEALDVGGNTIKVTFDGFTTDNLHSDWDTFIPQKLIGSASLANAQTWANTLIAEINTGAFKSQAASWIANDDITDVITTATGWAADANKLVCTVVMPNGVAALQQGDLYPTYYNSVIGTVELQIAKAGYRLANWLDSVFAANIAKRELGENADLVSRVPVEIDTVQLRPYSRAQLAREAAFGGGCGCEQDKAKRGHSHAH